MQLTLVRRNISKQYNNKQVSKNIERFRKKNQTSQWRNRNKLREGKLILKKATLCRLNTTFYCQFINVEHDMTVPTKRFIF